MNRFLTKWALAAVLGVASWAASAGPASAQYPPGFGGGFGGVNPFFGSPYMTGNFRYSFVNPYTGGRHNYQYSPYGGYNAYSAFNPYTGRTVNYEAYIPYYLAVGGGYGGYSRPYGGATYGGTAGGYGASANPITNQQLRQLRAASYQNTYPSGGYGDAKSAMSPRWTTAATDKASGKPADVNEALLKASEADVLTARPLNALAIEIRKLEEKGAKADAPLLPAEVLARVAYEGSGAGLLAAVRSGKPEFPRPLTGAPFADLRTNVEQHFVAAVEPVAQGKATDAAADRLADAALKAKADPAFATFRTATRPPRPSSWTGWSNSPSRSRTRPCRASPRSGGRRVRPPRSWSATWAGTGCSSPRPRPAPRRRTGHSTAGCRGTTSPWRGRRSRPGLPHDAPRGGPRPRGDFLRRTPAPAGRLADRRGTGIKGGVARAPSSGRGPTGRAGRTAGPRHEARADHRHHRARTAATSPSCCWKRGTRSTASSAGRAPRTSSASTTSPARSTSTRPTCSTSSRIIDVIKESNPDEVYNLAAQSFVPTSWKQPVLTGEFTAIGVTRVLEAIQLLGRDTHPVLPGVVERDVRQGAGGAAEGDDAVLPAQPLRRGQGVRPLDHGQLPRELRHVLL